VIDGDCSLAGFYRGLAVALLAAAFFLSAGMMFLSVVTGTKLTGVLAAMYYIEGAGSFAAFLGAALNAD